MADNPYLATDGDSLNAALLNNITGSIHERLEAREALEADFEGLIALGTGQALAVIQANVAPQLEAINDTVEGLQAAITEAEDKVAELLAGNLPASSVTFVAGGSISATNVQAAIAEVAADAADATAALATSTDTRLDAIETALPLKADAEDLASALADAAAVSIAFSLVF